MSDNERKWIHDISTPLSTATLLVEDLLLQAEEREGASLGFPKEELQTVLAALQQISGVIRGIKAPRPVR